MPENTVKENDEKQARIWGTLCHLTALIVITGLPFGHILGPLVIWLLKKNRYPFVNDQGKESLNFQLSMTVYVFVAALLIFVKIGTILLFVLVTVNLILVIIASVRTFNGETFRYPFKIRFIK